MKKVIVMLAATVGLAACSPTHHTASFKSYAPPTEYTTITTPHPIEAPVLASTSPDIAPTEKKSPFSDQQLADARKVFQSLPKSQQRAIRKEVKAEIRNYVKANKANVAPHPQQRWNWDQDLKFATIFGAIGLTALIIGTTPFWVIGAVCLIVGVVFLVKWLVRQ